MYLLYSSVAYLPELVTSGCVGQLCGNRVYMLRVYCV